MKLDFKDLILGIPQINRMVAGAALDVAQKLTLDVHRNVVLASPVDTGTFRGAWTADVPNRPFVRGTVSNATAYGPYLLDGRSTQAPAGWLDNAVQSATRLGGS